MTRTQLKPLKGPFGFFQMAYVTSDLDRATAEFGALYGASRFMVHDNVEIQTTAGIANARFALAFVGDQQLEVIQPTGGADAAYKDALPAGQYATRLHHFGRLVLDEAEWESTRASLLQSGLPLPIGGVAVYEGSPWMHYLYADTRASLGHYLEFMYRTEAGRGIFDEVPRF